MFIPSIGRVVHYSLTAYNANAVNRRRNDARENKNVGQYGFILHSGNDVVEGDIFPLIITRVWGPPETPTAFNGQLLLDGNDTLWVTSTSMGDGPGKCVEPPRV